MGATQIAEMMPSLSEVYRGISSPDDPPALSCTFEVTSSSEVWIQVLPGNVNMAFPFTEEPFELLRRQGVRSPAEMYLVEWAAGEYATFGFDNVSPGDHAFFVDQLFVKILGCDDASYEVRITIEPLEV